MNAEVVVKKRGRPKKADVVPDATKSQTSQPTKSRPVKSGTSARDFSTTEVISQKPAAKKSTRKKQAVILDDGQEGVEASELEQTAKLAATRPKSKSAILEQAKAFDTHDYRVNGRNKEAVPLHEAKNLENEMMIVPNGLPSQPESETQNLAHQEVSPQVNEQQNLSSNTTSSSSSSSSTTRSSFLSDFLSHSDAGPQISEDSRISDRAAFSGKAPSIDALVGGTGISSLLSFENMTQQESIKPVRDSTIPITPPKAFRKLTLTRFPNTSEQSRMSRRIDPTTYATGSFSAFKSTQPLSGIASSSSAAAAKFPLARTNTLSTTEHPQASASTSTQSSPLPTTSKQQTAPLKTSSKPQIQPQPQTQPAHPTSTSTRSGNPPPPPSPSNQPSRPLGAASTFSTPPTKPSSVASGAASNVQGKKRPTEMSPAELRANPEFRTLRRRWTGLIVGIPVLVATTYVLWKRFDMDAKEEEHRLSWQLGSSSAQQGRERGVLPSK